MEIIANSPLTFGQLSLWRALENLPPQRLTVANLIRSWDIPQDLAHADVEAAWSRLVQRHEGLRTSYRFTGPRGIEQVIYAAEPVALPSRPARGTARDDALSVARELASCPFDLTSAPLWRAVILTEGDRPAQLAVSIHHMCADRISLDLLHNELVMLFAGTEPNEPAPTCREIAATQTSPAWVARNQAAINYWRRSLADAPTPTPLPGPNAATFSATLNSAAVRGGLTKLVNALGVSMQNVLLTAFCSTMAQRLRQDRLLIALMAGNRVDPRMQNLVSSVNQLVPMLFNRTAADDFSSLARHIHLRTLRAYRHGCFDVDEASEVGRPYGVNGLGKGLGFVFSFLPGRPPSEPAPEGEGPDAWHVDVRSDGRPLPFPLYFQVGYTDGLWSCITVRRDVDSAESGDAFVQDITEFLEEFHAMLMEEIRAATG